MLLVRKQDLTALESPGGNRTSGVFTPGRGARDVSVIRQVQQAGGQNPPHYHDRDETLLLLSGTLQVTIGDQTTDLQAGDSVLIPAGNIHALANRGEEAAEWFVLAPLPIRFFRADGEEVFPEWAR